MQTHRMFVYRVLAALFPLLLPPQEGAKRALKTDPAATARTAQAAEVPQFPTDEALFVVRGKVRADAMFTVPAHPDFAPRRAGPNVLDLTLPNTVVYVSGIEDRWRFRPPNQDPIVFKLGERGLLPPVAVVRGQQTFTIAPADGRRWDFLLQGERNRFGLTVHGGPSKPTTALAPDRLIVTCKQRPALRAYLQVMPHPIFAVTDKDGRFALPPLPRGDYELVAVHDLLGRAAVRLGVDRTAQRVTIVLKAPARLRVSHGR